MQHMVLLFIQVNVCAEDFEHEREDRARAQAEKDDMSQALVRKTEEIQTVQESVSYKDVMPIQPKFIFIVSDS